MTVWYDDGVAHHRVWAFDKWDPEFMVGADDVAIVADEAGRITATGYAYHLSDVVEALGVEADGAAVDAEIAFNQPSPDQFPYHPEAAQRLNSRFRLTFDAPDDPHAAIRLTARLAARGEAAFAVSQWRSRPLEDAPEAHVVPVKGRPDMRFHVEDPDDHIQGRFHLNGDVYEQVILEHLRHMIPPRSTILDIGANVGNHLIWFHQVMKAERVVPFEPNPKAIRLLVQNIALNDARNVDLRWLGRCVSATGGDFALKHCPKGNLGGTRFAQAAGEGGAVSVAVDDVMRGERADLIKVDVEDMEMDVLASASATIARWRPVLAVETTAATRDAMRAWRAANSYLVERRFGMYRDCWTELLIPS